MHRRPGLRLLFDGHRMGAVDGAPRHVAIEGLLCSGRLTGLTAAIGRQLRPQKMRTDGYGHLDGSVGFRRLACRACCVGDCTGGTLVRWSEASPLAHHSSAPERRDAASQRGQQGKRSLFVCMCCGCCRPGLRAIRVTHGVGDGLGLEAELQMLVRWCPNHSVSFVDVAASWLTGALHREDPSTACPEIQCGAVR